MGGWVGAAAKRRDLSQAAELLVLGTWLKADQLPVLISLAEVYQELLQHKKALNAWRLALKAAPQVRA
jgi:Tfp pilus assembly protein PilF